MERQKPGPLAGWGRYPVQDCHAYRPERRGAVAGLLASGRESSWIARGLGRSYGDAALNRGAGVILMERLDRFLAFDPATGVLECDAGVSFAELIEVFLARGFFPPVTPGTKFVTLGGAVANDVHGKNHHVDGTLETFLEGLEVLLPDGRIEWCSREIQPDLYRATVGGVGLTGVILTVRLRLRPVESSWVLVDRKRVGDLEGALEAMEADDDRYPYSVAWIDCLATGARLGRSILMRGRHAPREVVARAGKAQFAAAGGFGIGVPFEMPSGLLNRVTVSAFNAAYYAAHPDAFDCLESYEKFFYPLDSIGLWNRIYGRAGFVQYQAAFPMATARRGLVELIERISETGRASFLAVLKRFGRQGIGWLSYPIEGFTLSLDIPASKGIQAFLAGLDAIVLEHGGRLYLGKDASMSREVFDASYPEAPRFRALVRANDPSGRISSSMGRRLGLVAA